MTVLPGEGNPEGFDQLALERAVRSLCKVGIRRAPLSLERVKSWMNQFEGPSEKSLAWLILRHLVYRTGEQLESSLRQALKDAATHFLRSAEVAEGAHWRDALAGRIKGLSFYCGPPDVNGMTKPGKSGEVVTRIVNRNYAIDKYYPHDVSQFEADERYLVVDDGAYTGIQLVSFLEGWRNDYSDGKVAIVVGLAHTRAIATLHQRFPSVPLFYGELMTERNSLQSLSEQWIADGQWTHPGVTPREVYADICRRRGPFGSATEGFGSLGLMVAFEHGVPDDSLHLLWNKSANWTPLIER
ncbi:MULTISPECIES: hypothetical protein [Paraburkholderia]|uniref:phosphoribosyltransferase-like protein n=1 Tax=Paraburkholderia TaxID=1822464 RepID=UPI001CAED676|nr:MULTISPECIES: hypothetical protein [Paraburkholderia]CAG9193532.1 conserved hypothetical protein [Paraburkholderia caribensis]